MRQKILRSVAVLLAVAAMFSAFAHVLYGMGWTIDREGSVACQNAFGGESVYIDHLGQGILCQVGDSVRVTTDYDAGALTLLDYVATHPHLVGVTVGLFVAAFAIAFYVNYADGGE